MEEEEMIDVNRVCLLGTLADNPELKVFNGKECLKLRVATVSGKGDKEFTNWHSVQAWAGLARKGKDARKGDRVYVEGSLKTRSYDKNGEKRYITEVDARALMIGPPDAGDVEHQRYEGGRGASAKHATDVEDLPGVDQDFGTDSDIPFIRDMTGIWSRP